MAPLVRRVSRADLRKELARLHKFLFRAEFFGLVVEPLRLAGSDVAAEPSTQQGQDVAALDALVLEAFQAKVNGLLRLLTFAAGHVEHGQHVGGLGGRLVGRAARLFQHLLQRLDRLCRAAVQGVQPSGVDRRLAAGRDRSRSSLATRTLFAAREHVEILTGLVLLPEAQENAPIDQHGLLAVLGRAALQDRIGLLLRFGILFLSNRLIHGAPFGSFERDGSTNLSKRR